MSALAFSPDGERLATGDDRGQVRVWKKQGAGSRERGAGRTKVALLHAPRSTPHRLTQPIGNWSTSSPGTTVRSLRSLHARWPAARHGQRRSHLRTVGSRHGPGTARARAQTSGVGLVARYLGRRNACTYHLRRWCRRGCGDWPTRPCSPRSNRPASRSIMSRTRPTAARRCSLPRKTSKCRLGSVGRSGFRVRRGGFRIQGSGFRYKRRCH